MKLTKDFAVFSKLSSTLQETQYATWLESDTPELQIPASFIDTLKPISNQQKSLYE